MCSFFLEDHPATVQKTNSIIYIACTILIKTSEKNKLQAQQTQSTLQEHITIMHNDFIL